MFERVRSVKFEKYVSPSGPQFFRDARLPRSLDVKARFCFDGGTNFGLGKPPVPFALYFYIVQASISLSSAY
jgi:hypothetical protein